MNAAQRRELPDLQSTLPVCLAIVFWMGCGSTTTNIQSVSVSGPLFQPPVHLNRTAEELGIRVSPWLTYLGQQERFGNVREHSPVNAAGQYQVDTVVANGQIHLYENPADTNRYHGNNYSWRLPSISGGANFDLDFSKYLSCFLGFGMTTVQSDLQWSAHTGLSFNVQGPEGSARLEFLVTLETVSTSVEAVERITRYHSDKTEVQFFSRQSKSMQKGWCLLLTLQGSAKNAFPYVQFAFGVQQIIGSSYFNDIIVDSEIKDMSVSFFSITPGLALRLGENLRLISGIRFTGDQRTGGLKSSPHVTPLVQLEISF